LGPLVARTVELIESGHAQMVSRDPGVLRVTLLDPDRPGDGSITLIFRDQPLELRQWKVIDSQGLVTLVALTGMRINLSLAPELFLFDDPTVIPEEQEAEPESAP
jgi:outer membrane lipoprotein-sorting protein